MKTRSSGIAAFLFLPFLASAQGGDQQVRVKADQLFQEQRFAEAMPLYSQLVSLSPSDRTLNYRFGACLLHGSADKEPAIGHLKFATDAPTTDPLAWYWLGRAYHLNYRFKDAQAAYQRFLGTADKKLLAQWPVEALQKQCRNGEKLLSSLKEITVRSKVEVADADFFRFYDLTDIGGRIVVLPDELKTSFDKKKKERNVIYMPERQGPIYFSSYGKDGATGKDIYRTELLPDGTFAAPVKLAGYINTEQDEDYPFMHPDGRTFFFCSKGHNSMGGYDVFRASFDKGLDAFGRPENLDFAVSTPDDDVLYIVDAEQKEACFASGRNSKQGMLHVYRVGTAQAPVMITVFKGTYASSIEKEDRKARVVVEDALTQEQVADTRTDINGNYVLSLPRAGRYRYRVDCGPTGKTHGGIVEVPKAEGPRAYRQELILDRKGDQEQLTIRNYFDEPLSEDMVALALDEIKRRARLDVSSREIAAVQPPSKDEPTGDVMTRAGFTGDIDRATALKLAQEDARELDALAMDQQAQAAEAFALAMDAANESERSEAKAAQLLRDANAEANDESKRNAMLSEAARDRYRAREAALRARAAHSTGVALSTAAMATRQQAAQAAKLSSDLASTAAAKDDEKALVPLRTLKQRLDEKSKPDMARDPVEMARRQLTEQEKEAARLLSMAQSKRDEENEVADRIARLKRERDDTRARSRQEDLTRQITDLEHQQRYLRDETRAAVNKATAAERQTAALRGQASLTRHLAQVTDRGAGSELTVEQAERLGMRISGSDQRAAGLVIDERFDAEVASERAQDGGRIFDWDLASAAQAVGDQREATRALDRSAQNDAQRAEGRSTELTSASVGEKATRSATVAQVPQTAGSERTETAVAREQGAGERMSPRGTQVSTGGTEQARPLDAPAMSGTSPMAQSAEVEDRGSIRSPQHQNARGQETDRPSTVTERSAGSSEPAAGVFLLENERSELIQLAAAERNRARKDSLTRRIAQIDTELAKQKESETKSDEEVIAEVDMNRPLLVFATNAKDEEVIGQVYRSYTADMERAQRLTDADMRADAVNGIELMLADSLRAEQQRQVAVLQLAPQQAEAVLPRVDRLRRLREEHVAKGEAALAQRQEELAAASSPTQELGRTSAAPVDGASVADRINERYVAIDRYARNVLGSKVEHRSNAKGVREAIAFHDADLARIEDISSRIDSMEKQLAGMPLGKESDRLRKKADQLIDERFIIRTDLGQRSAFLMREEWKTAQDSLKKVEAITARRSLPVDEPLVQMAREFATEAKSHNESAAQLRKRADRSEDIVLRDSLYRRAYRDELLALRAMDKAITVQGYVGGDRHQRGERLTYEELATRLFGIKPFAEQPALARTEERSNETAVMDGKQPSPSGLVEPMTSSGNVSDSKDGLTGEQAAVNQAAEAEAEARPQTTEPVVEQRRALAVSGQQTDAPARTLATSADARASASAGNTAPGSAASSTQAVISRAEERLDAKDKVPARLYERFLGSETVTLSAVSFEPDSDPNLLLIRSERSQQEAVDLEQRSQRAADRASALMDSAATARRRDRERLEMMATRQRAMSDSLHTASLAKGQEGGELQRMAEEAVVARNLRERLIKFYYLSPEEQKLVMLEGDASRYFQARAKAQEQMEAAELASSSAKSHRDVAVILKQQARAAEREAVQGRIPAAEASQRALTLEARATQLSLKADSLENIASRLRGAAGINEAQSSAMLQTLPDTRATELMALEQRTRRNESLLAESRGEAARRSNEPVRLERPAPAASGTSTAPPSNPPAQEPIALRQPVRSAAPEPAVQPGVRAVERNDAQPAVITPFRMPDELVEDLFVLNEPSAKRIEPIPMNVDLPQGIVFKVQIGAFSKPVPQEAFSDMTPVMGETVGNGLVRYTAGLFTSADGALAAKDRVRERGYGDAFVVAYRDGQRVPLGEAMRAAREQQRPAQVAQRRVAEEPEQRIAPQRPAVEQPASAVIARPAAPQLTAEEETATILARYPASAEQLIAAFTPSAEAASYYNVPGAAPAKQVETIRGLFFTVQVGVYSRPVPLDKLFNITPLNSELTETAKVRYTTGTYLNMDAVRVRKDEAVRLGVKDAFITAYLNGKRIPVREATALIERFGPSILAQP